MSLRDAVEKRTDARVHRREGTLVMGQSGGQSKGICQVCQRSVQILRNGTSRYHGRGRCPGSGYRVARWSAGQRLYHHSGDIWQIVGEQPCRFNTLERAYPDDYLVECVAGREQGRKDSFHAEYMHRHGWYAAEDVERV